MGAFLEQSYNAIKNFKKPGKQMFWAWIAYQTIKGTLTTSLIWVPLIWSLMS
jgi:hypothetical protein